MLNQDVIAIRSWRCEVVGNEDSLDNNIITKHAVRFRKGPHELLAPLAAALVPKDRHFEPPARMQERRLKVGGAAKAHGHHRLVVGAIYRITNVVG